VSGRRRDIVVEVRRDFDGRLYSQVVDRIEKARYESGQRRRGKELPTFCVVVDRQRGRLLDSETVLNRAGALAEVLGVQLDEDLFWPCRARQGYTQQTCSCPACAERTNAREAKRK
jgi:hypothetical protein